MAEASTTTVRTVISAKGGVSTGLDSNGSGDEAAGVLNGFAGVALDAEAQAAIAAALEACAARARAADAAYEAGGPAAAEAAADDPEESFVRTAEGTFLGELEFPGGGEVYVPFAAGEGHWTQAGAEMPDWARLEAEREGDKGKADPGSSPG